MVLHDLWAGNVDAGTAEETEAMSDRDRAKTLYEELTNDQATWVDAVFWMVLGALVAEMLHWVAL